MPDSQTPTSPPPSEQSTIRPRTASSSPTANRVASGRPVPRPLEFHKPTSLNFDSPPPSLDDLESPRSASYSLSQSGRTPPLTPDRDLTSAGRANGTKRFPSAMNSAARAAAWSTGGKGLRAVSDSKEEPAPTSARSGGHRSSSAAKISHSASSASLSGHPRASQSVLGYSSVFRGPPSPLRSARNEIGGGVAVSPAPGMGNSTRYLLTVIPPTHLPHDPPHPRTNPQCSGYGPPEHFRRGTLVPLYPTLSSQLAAIAREYGLPSTGGLVLYLLSTSDPSSSIPQPLPGSVGFAGEGGPRISEAAWSLLWARLFEEDEEVMLLAEESATDDEEDYAPPVPPIPASHRNGENEAEVQGRRRSDSEQASLSPDEDQDRAGFSSDAGASADSASSTYDPAAPVQPKLHQGSSSTPGRRSSSIGRSGIGRGPPPSLPSPGGRTSHQHSSSQHRFASLPASASNVNLRHSSRNSVHSTRSTRQYYMHPPPSVAGRSVSYGSYAPSTASMPPTPGYGASVIVGRVEFDIDRSRGPGGKSKWYDTWVEGAIPPSFEQSPAVLQTVDAGVSSLPRGSQPGWQELKLPEIVKSKTPLNEGLEFDDAFTSEQQASPVMPREEQAANEASDQSAATDMRLRTVSGNSRGMESATSAWSLAGMAERVEETEQREAAREAASRGLVVEERAVEQEEGGEDSIVEKGPSAMSRSSSSLPSRPASNASTAVAESERGTDDSPLIDEQGGGAYQQLDDDAEQEPLKPASSDASDSSEYGGEHDKVDDEGALSAPPQADPLGDVFESDEATWSSFSNDDSVKVPRERDAIETTGLGIVGARVADFAASAPPGVLERLPHEQQSLDEEGIPPPQDDVADVFAMLNSIPSASAADGPLASPIRLDSSPSAPANSGVFPPSSPRGDDDAEKASPFTVGHSTNTSISTVNFNVRPPSTIASMSPEFVPQRKQRQGWTNVPAVIDPSLSASSSLSSIAPLAESQRASTIGLMENLDDLERALAELSPSAGKPRAAPEPIVEEETAPSTESVAAPSILAPPRSSSRSEEEAPSPSSLTVEDPAHEEDDRREVEEPSSTEEPLSATAAQQEYLPAAENVRIPRSSSLSKQEHNKQQPASLVALPPSPMMSSPASLPSLSDNEEPTPKLPSAGPSWSAPALPPSPPRPPIFLPNASNFAPPPPVPSKVENDVALVPEVAAFPAPPPRSPGPVKSLRMGKPWGHKEGRSIKADKGSSPDPAAEESGSKSPLGSFFHKSPFGKAKGFFKKSETSHAEPPSPSSPSPKTSPVFPSAATAEAPPVVRKDSLEVPSITMPASERMPGSPAGPRPRRPSMSSPSVAETSFAAPSAPLPAELQPRPSIVGDFHPDSFQTALTSFSRFPMPTPHAITTPPVESSRPSFSPRLSPPLLSPTSCSFEPRPSQPPSPSRSDFHLSSPRSEYAPQTPRAGAPISPALYPASAPVTPANWPNSRFNGGGKDKGKGKHRLSADIDQLLSQMNDIDFGFDGEDDEKEDGTETAPVQVVEPKREQEELEEDRPKAARDERNEDGAGRLQVMGGHHRGQDSEGRPFPLSADLTALGSMMTGLASPPLSPESSANAGYNDFSPHAARV
ncbi:hypothetical protein JCM21900_002691 [Sporobolomyces salmonicolor]